MRKKIELRGQTLEYELERKDVKNINLRVRADGVHVSASRAVPVALIENFLRANAEAILFAVSREREKQQTAPAALPLEDGDTIPLFGANVPIHVAAGKKNTAELRGRAVFLTLTEPENTALRQKLLDRLERELCAAAVTDICRAVYPHFAALGVGWPEISFRRMRSRWGSCTPSKGTLRFNIALVSVPPECIEYVVVHEFCHFLQQNHSPLFYAEVEKLIPDRKAREAKLRGYKL